MNVGSFVFYHKNIRKKYSKHYDDDYYEKQNKRHKKYIEQDNRRLEKLIYSNSNNKKDN